jgi:hypothetical protein
VSRTLVIGDSLQVGTGPNLKGMKVDARGGRPSTEGVERLRALWKSGKYDRLVFDMGTNDGSARVLRKSIRQARRVVGKDVPIHMGYVNSPSQQKQKNRMLKRMASRDKIELFNPMHVDRAGDGIHATPEGYQQRAKIIRKAVKANSPQPQERQQAAGSTSLLSPQQILAIDTTRINGSSAQDIHEALEKFGIDADAAYKEYANTPFADGRLRGEVNLGDPDEWDVK